MHGLRFSSRVRKSRSPTSRTSRSARRVVERRRSAAVDDERTRKFAGPPARKLTNMYGAVYDMKATSASSCAALRECKIKEGPRKLLGKVKGLELIEMAENETCCGFGGSFAVKFESISIAMADQKINHALASGAEYIISTILVV